MQPCHSSLVLRPYAVYCPALDLVRIPLNRLAFGAEDRNSSVLKPASPRELFWGVHGQLDQYVKFWLTVISLRSIGLGRVYTTGFVCGKSGRPGPLEWGLMGKARIGY